MADTSYKIDVSPDGEIYWFTSTGPKGSIRKVVIMQPMARFGRYNLAMADEIDGQLDYDNITNNNDLDLVFGSIASIVRHFTDEYPGAEVYVEGSTPARARLYRMQVSNNLELIEREFHVYGIKVGNRNFTRFKKGENYIGILVSRK